MWDPGSSVGGRLRLSSVLLASHWGSRGHRGRCLLLAQSPTETLTKLLDSDLKEVGEERGSDNDNDKMIHHCLH